MALRQFFDEMKDFFTAAPVEDHFSETYRRTPKVVEERVQQFVEQMKSDVEREVDADPTRRNSMLRKVGSWFRDYYIEGRGVTAKSGCYEYSRRLRDIYNHLFGELSLMQQAHLAFGTIGQSVFANHYWVAIAEAGLIPILKENEVFTDQQKSANLKILGHATFVDGTADQFLFLKELLTKEGSGKAVVINPHDQKLRPSYHLEGISPVPVQYFRR